MRHLLLALTVVVSLVATPATAQGPGPSTAAADPVDCLRDLAGIDLQTVTIPGLQAAMAAGTITSAELTARYLDRIAAFDTDPGGPALNSVMAVNPTAMDQARALDAERAAGAVRGPLHGIPVLLKDNIGTVDLPTTAGSIALEGNIPVRDSFQVRLLREAGAVILGKTNLSEFANWMDPSMPSGFSSLGGQVRNSYSRAINPSGSSSGSGTAGAMALAAATLGSETSGSILSPSQVQSLAAVKPTVGLVSRTGVIPLAPSFDTTGPMVRSVTDAAVLLGAIAGVDEEDAATAAAAGNIPAGGDYTVFLDEAALEGVRLGVENRAGQPAAVREAIDVLEAEGAEIVPIEDFNDRKTVGLAEIGAIFGEFHAYLNSYLTTEAQPPTGVQSLRDIVLFNQQRSEDIPYGQNYLVVSAATPGVAESTIPQSVTTRLAAQTVIDTTLEDHDVDAILSSGNGNANIGAAAGYPTVAVPASADTTRPTSLAFLGTAWSEPQLLGFAYDYEQATALRTPPTEVNPDELATPACTGGAGVGTGASVTGLRPSAPRPLAGITGTPRG